MINYSTHYASIIYMLKCSCCPMMLATMLAYLPQALNVYNYSQMPY